MKSANESHPYWRSIRRRLGYYKRRLIWLAKWLKTPRAKVCRFRCNVCGRMTSFPVEELSREHWSCVYCGSNVRWRSVIHALSTELFGVSMAISDFPNRPDISGVGLSDWEGYATRLEKKLNYVNTFYHQGPFLDITSVDQSQSGLYNFIISTDVFEHICPPITRAFENARRLLKPGGIMVFTVPYVEGETREHFPETSRFTVQKKGSEWTLLSETNGGKTREYADITFHGGPGATVEFRLFGKEALLRDCRNAGFNPIRIHEEVVQEYGIRWIPYDAEKAPYRPLIYGLDTPPWVLVNGSGSEMEKR